MATTQLRALNGTTAIAGGQPDLSSEGTAKIKSVEYFRVKPRWLFVKICDGKGNYGWGEATLEGHDKAVEGALDEIIERIVGLEAEYVVNLSPSFCRFKKIKSRTNEYACIRSNIEHIWQLIWRLGFYRGGPVFMSALSGIDIALWDLKGEILCFEMNF